MSTTHLFMAGLRRRVPALVMIVLLVPILSAQAALPMAGSDGVVIVVSSTSSVTEIPRNHLADLYLGRTTRFPGGAAAVPIDQRPGSAVRVAFSEAYLGRSEAQLKAHWSKIIFTGRGRPPAEAATDEVLREMVARNPAAIGYLNPGLVDASVRVVRVR